MKRRLVQRELDLYQVVFGGCAIVKVRATDEDKACEIASQNLDRGDFQVTDHVAFPMEESEKV